MSGEEEDRHHSALPSGAAAYAVVPRPAPRCPSEGRPSKSIVICKLLGDLSVSNTTVELPSVM